MRIATAEHAAVHPSVADTCEPAKQQNAEGGYGADDRGGYGVSGRTQRGLTVRLPGDKPGERDAQRPREDRPQAELGKAIGCLETSQVGQYAEHRKDHALLDQHVECGIPTQRNNRGVLNPMRRQAQ